MIKLSVRGLAKFMISKAAAQRKVLHDYKYADEDEPFAMRLYYKDTVERVQAFHAKSHERGWLRAQASQLEALARTSPAATASRLRNNARALIAYDTHFAKRRLDVKKPPRLRVTFGEVTVTVTPDLFVTDRDKVKLIKFDFSKDEPDSEAIKVVSQIMYEAAKEQVPGLTSSAVLYVDVARGLEYKGARAGARTMRDIEAACANISSLWPGI
jgi:hypothetical protein